MVKRFLKAPSAKFRIALGLIGLLTSLLLTAEMLNLVPDRLGAQREGRTALAEAVAANNTIFLTREDNRRLESVLRLVVDRNDELLSAAVRQSNGKVVTEIGEHRKFWQESSDDYSIESNIHVPIWAGQEKWGQIELRFIPLRSDRWYGALQHPLVKLVAFMTILGFIAFYLYLGKMLKQLDPSQAIPDRVRATLDTMAEGLLVMDRKEQIVLANRAFAKLMGKDSLDLVGVKASDLKWSSTSDQPFDAQESPWRKALLQGKPQMNQTVRLQTSASGQRTFMVNCSPVLGDNDKAGGVLISFDDVTVLEEKEVELRNSKEEAEEANRAKSDFLANMSHEIRTPMNAILGFTEVLRRGYGNNKQDSKKHLNTIYSSGKHLLALINDILDLSKVEAGRIDVEKLSSDPYRVVREIVQILSVKAREKNITLDFEVDGLVPETIHTDPARLRQIITNLVGNSLKFTERGGVKVTARFINENNVPRLLLDIADTGIGMTDEQQKVIFDPFSQADSSINRRFGGTGLGLSISLRFAEAMGGKITVRSTPGEGSVFTLTLVTGSLHGIRMLEPEEVLVGDEELIEETTAQWKFSPSRILVVDDGEENRDLVRLVLEEVGLIIDTAENGRIACDMVKTQSYDIILMDIQMPVMDGYTATRKLRDKGIQIPIFALTANAMHGIEKKCEASGFTGVMTKPVDIDALINTLAERLDCQRVTDSDIPIDSEALLNILDAAAGTPIVSRLAQSPKFSALIKRFTQRLDEQLAAMEKACNENNFDELKALGHWLKGSGGTVGFDDFTEPAKQLEQFANEHDAPKARTCVAKLRALRARITLNNTIENSTPAAGTTQADATDIPEFLLSRLDQNNPRLHKIIEKFVTRLQVKLEAMDSALEQNNFDDLASLAHWLKGAGGTVGFDAFTEPAALLEQSAISENDTQCRQVIGTLKRLSKNIVIADNTAMSAI